MMSSPAVGGELVPLAALNKSRVNFSENTSVLRIESTRSVLAKQSPTKISNSTQTGKNVSKVRWMQDGQTMMIPDPWATEYFVSGSWSHSNNDVSLWRLKVDEPDNNETPVAIAQVDLIDKMEAAGNVTDMSVLNSKIFAMTTSLGTVSVYKCGQDNQEDLDSISILASNRLHHLRNQSVTCPATALAVKENIVSVGEDGSIIESSITTFQVIRSLEEIDALSLYSVSFVGRSEILTGNAGGQLKLWDLRSNDKCPTQIMNPNVLMNNLYGAISIAQHPSQSHLIIVGYQSGLVDLWDLRLGSGCDPVANLASDSGSLSEIYFHKINPDHFYSCAQSGQVCHWYPKMNAADEDIELMQDDVELDLNIEFLKRGLVFKDVYMSPLPINSVSLSKNDRLVCGGDSGVVFCTELSSA